MSIESIVAELPLEARFQMLDVAANRQYKDVLAHRVRDIKEQMVSLIVVDNDAAQFVMDYKLLANEKQFLEEHLDVLQTIFTQCTQSGE